MTNKADTIEMIICPDKNFITMGTRTVLRDCIKKQGKDIIMLGNCTEIGCCANMLNITCLKQLNG
jgi:hypothetical protein